MTGPRPPVRSRIELLDDRPSVKVAEAEYRRLLGYPAHHAPGEHADELAARARRWYAVHGHPWIYLREADLEVTDDRLRLDGVEFGARPLREYFREARATRALLVMASAGRACEEQAAEFWRDGKPDEYFFFETFASAVVEHLMATVSGRICDLAERDGLMAVTHYSPGYTGWNVADQPRLFEVITRGLTRALPDSIEVLESGMPRPKKSLLAVVGLTARRPSDSPHLTPCERCAFAPCEYRRAAYRHGRSMPGNEIISTRPNGAAAPAAWLNPGAKYTVNQRALAKWARERVRVEPQIDGTVEACFRFDGTTCSNLGHPLAFDYTVTLGAPADACTILRADCRPAAGDKGHTQMCAYLSDAPALLGAINSERPLLGRPLAEVFDWVRPVAPSGCHCSAYSRAHNWGLALEAIHYALATGAAEPALTFSRPSHDQAL